ncbi:radical SAM protein with 4Fe4S-binding SPASM domain [Olsenella profusa DSM 13989]|nr:radical SAM protein with 4Fe4S-binding SPASM domain [Olsenella profusa DSM 13989]
MYLKQIPQKNGHVRLAVYESYRDGVGNKAYSFGSLKEKTDFFGYIPDWVKKERLSPACMHCEIEGYCGGGCVIERSTKGIPAICKYEKENFRLFVDRILVPRVRQLLSEHHSPCT